MQVWLSIECLYYTQAIFAIDKYKTVNKYLIRDRTSSTIRVYLEFTKCFDHSVSREERERERKLSTPEPLIYLK